MPSHERDVHVDVDEDFYGQTAPSKYQLDEALQKALGRKTVEFKTMAKVCVLIAEVEYEG